MFAFGINEIVNLCCCFSLSQAHSIFLCGCHYQYTCMCISLSPTHQHKDIYTVLFSLLSSSSSLSSPPFPSTLLPLSSSPPLHCLIRLSLSLSLSLSIYLSLPSPTPPSLSHSLTNNENKRLMLRGVDDAVTKHNTNHRVSSQQKKKKTVHN